MRPLIGEEKQAAGEDIKHVKILSEENLELLKDEAPASTRVSAG